MFLVFSFYQALTKQSLILSSAYAVGIEPPKKRQVVDPLTQHQLSSPLIQEAVSSDDPTKKTEETQDPVSAGRSALQRGIAQDFSVKGSGVRVFGIPVGHVTSSLIADSNNLQPDSDSGPEARQLASSGNTGSTSSTNRGTALAN